MNEIRENIVLLKKVENVTSNPKPLILLIYFIPFIQQIYPGAGNAAFVFDANFLVLELI